MNISLNRVVVKIPTSERFLFKVHRLEVASGSHILIKGESGKGKTTLLHLIAGLLNPLEGSICLNQVDLQSLNEHDLSELRRDKIGLVFQKLNLIDHLTALENVLLSCRDQAGRTQDAIKILETVGLKGKEHVCTAFLSLGEQQRVAVARVLIKNPEIILADEPTSSLDETNSINIMQLLVSAAKGKTLLVVSHDQRIDKYFQKIYAFEDLVRL